MRGSEYLVAVECMRKSDSRETTDGGARDADTAAS